MLDFGLLAYCQGPVPEGVRQGSFGGKAGTFVTGSVALGIDPFDYFERLNRGPGIPALIYTWAVERIERQTAPFLEVKPRTFVRDKSRLAWVDVEATDAWDDDGGHAEYLLHCRRLDVSPMRERPWGAA